MRILVSGACGYVGSSLCRLLLDLGYDVKAVDNFHKGQGDALIPYCSDKHFEFEYGDVSNPKHAEKMVQDVDCIIHLAGIVGFPAASKNPGLSQLVNVEGTKNIIKYKNKDTKLIFSSTGSVYGKVEDICTEETPTNPQSVYGIHKLEAEKIVLDAENTFAYRFATGFGVSPCMRVNLLVNDLTYKAYTDKVLVIFQADFKRSFIHVNDMALSFAFGIQKLNENSKYRLFNVGCPSNNISKRQLAEIIREKTGCTVVHEEISEDADQRSYEVDFSRFEKTVGWLPKVSVGYGIDEILKVCPILQMRNPYS